MHVDVVAGLPASPQGEHLAGHHVVAVEDRTDGESGRDLRPPVVRQFDLHGVILAHVESGVQIGSSNDGDGLAGSLIGSTDRLYGAGELVRIEVIGEEVHVFGGPVHQAVRHQRVAAGQCEPVVLRSGQPDSGELAVPWIHPGWLHRRWLDQLREPLLPERAAPQRQHQLRPHPRENLDVEMAGQLIRGAGLADDGSVEQLGVMLVVHPVGSPGRPGELWRWLYLTMVWSSELIEVLWHCVRTNVNVPKVSFASGTCDGLAAHGTEYARYP